MTQQFANSDFSRYVAAAEERAEAEEAAPAGSVGAMRCAPARPCPVSALAEEATAKGPRLAPQCRITGAHGVTLAGFAPQGGGFPLWAQGATRRPAAALLRDIAEAHAAAALFD